MSNHTLSPWKIREDEETKNYWFIEAGCGFHNVKTDNGFCLTGYMSAADARLIAAAPELLEACKAILRASEMADRDIDDALTLCEKAVKAAEEKQ